MRNLRKLTAVLLAVALVLTSMTAAFAATESTTTVVNGDKAAVLKELKLYAGTDVNDPAKGLEAALKVQDSLIWLATEFGYKAEAEKLTDEDAAKILEKFEDAKDVSDYAKKVVAYSVQEGIIAGSKTNDGKFYIRPTASVTAARFATFMLQGMGYKLTGSYTEAVAQLKEVEGSKIDDVAGDLTRDAAVGFMYGILTAKTASGKTVAENLLAADSSLQATLSKYSLLPVNGSIAVDSVKAVANNKVAVTLKEEANATAADFAIVKKNTTEAVAVKNVVKESAKLLVLETDALTGGTGYTLTANGTSVNFTGIAADNSAPTIVKLTAPDTNTFEIEFSDKMDFATATDVANYTWDKSLKTVKAELNGDRNKVKITTDVAKRNVYYTVTIANVKNSDGKAIAKTSRNIQAIEDKTAPKLDPIKVQNNRMFILNFQDQNGMNKAALETAANYSINDLAITSVTAYDTKGDNDGKYETVVVMTEAQTQGKEYTLTVENLTDNSVLANPLGKTTRKFRGAAVDKTSPTVTAGSSVTSENNNLVEIIFNDNNAMDVATLEDISNYTITYGNETLAVLSAKAGSTSYPDAYNNEKKTVTLTTEAQVDKKVYNLQIRGVADEFGNVIKSVAGKDPSFRFSGSAVDTQPPYIKKVEYVNSTEVKLTFDRKVDKATATDPTNYSFNKDIGSPVKASLEGGDKVVKLTTQSLAANTTYTITMNGIEDKFGNAMANVKVDLLTNTKEIDTTIPSISYIWAANDEEIHIFFDEKVTAWPNDITVKEIDGDKLVGTAIDMYYAGQFDDGKTLVYAVKKSTQKLKAIDYAISTTAGRFADGAGNKVTQYTATNPAIADRAVFTGNYFENERPAVTNVEQINVKKLKVTFSEPVALPASSGNFTFEKGNKDIADTHQTEWYVKRGAKFKSDEKITLDFSAWAKDFVGAKAIELNDETNTIFYTYMIDDVAPVIVDVKAVDNNTIEVVYDEDIDKAGTYKVTELYYDNSNNEKTRTVTIAGYSISDNVVKISTKTELALAKNYYLTPATAAQDLAGNKSDIKDIRWDFAGTDVETYNLIVKGVGTTNAKTIYVKTSEKIPLTGAIKVVEEGDPDINILPISYTLNNDRNEATITLPIPTVSGKNYLVTVTYGPDDSEDFGFEGNTPDIGMELERTRTGGVTLDLSDYDPTEFEAALLTTSGAIEIPGARTADGFTFAAAPATEYYVVLSRADDKDTVVYAAKVTVTIPDDVAELFMTRATANVTAAGLASDVVDNTTTGVITIALPLTTVNGTYGTIEWTSKKGSIDGSVYTAPERPTTVGAKVVDTLVATFTIGSETETKAFLVTVPDTGAVTVELDD